MNHHTFICKSCDMGTTTNVDNYVPLCCTCNKPMTYRDSTLGAYATPPQPAPATPPPAAPPSPSAHIYATASTLINGPRRDAYGPVQESFARMAAVYTVALQRKLKEPLDAKDVALLGVAMKLCREAHAHSTDNLVDLCGYAGLLAKLHAPAEPAPSTCPPDPDDEITRFATQPRSAAP